MNLYEITDIKTGKTIEPAVTLKQAAERLKCSRSAVSGAHQGNYAIGHRYVIEAVDTTIAKQDPIWLEWDLCRTTILRTCRRIQNDRKE